MTIYKGNGVEPSYTEVETEITAKSVSFWRQRDKYPAIFLTKAIVIGTACKDLEDAEMPLESDYEGFETFTITDLSSVVTTMPSYYRCGGRVTHLVYELTILFRDGNEFEKTGEVVVVDDWVSHDI